ncbi:glycosyltransferase [Rhizobium sp. YIM 134829]|uniref:glycosyltransferase n=1 Tax=Rhizobium sp. YIM 134829 TaxID=3390453 RepID=UPI00397D984C
MNDAQSTQSRTGSDEPERNENWLSAARGYANSLLLDSTDTNTWVQYGHALKEAECLEHAVEAYASAVRSDGTAVEPRLHLAHLLKRLGRTEEAIHAFQALAELPDAPPVAHEIGALRAAAEQSGKRTRPSPAKVDLSPDDIRLFDKVIRAAKADRHSLRTERRSGWPQLRTPPLQARITPQAHLVIRDETFFATTPDPQFAVVLETGEFVEGWYECQIEIEASIPVIEPILYVEWEANWSQFSFHRLGKIQDRSYCAIFYLDRPAIRMRLDPFTGEGPFLVPSFSLKKLGLKDVLTTIVRALSEAPETLSVASSLDHRKIGRALSVAIAHPAVSAYDRWIRRREPELTAYDTLASQPFDALIAPHLPSKARDFTTESIQNHTPWSIVRSQGQRTTKPSEYVAVIPAGHSISSQAAAAISGAIATNPAIDLLFGDDDEKDESGKRRNPRFKPDWNIDYFLSANFIGETFVVRQALLEPLLAKAPSASPSDMLIGLLLDRNDLTIEHIPVILSHRGASMRSPSDIGEETPAQLWTDQQQRELTSRLRGKHPGIEVRRADHGLLHVSWPLPKEPPLVSLLIPTRDHVDLLRNCIHSISSVTDYPSIEFVVVDNGSEDAATISFLDDLRRTQGFKVLPAPGPFNYSRLNNLAVQAASGQVVGLVNNDVLALEPNWLREMVGHALRPDVGAVGARLLYESGAIQHAGMVCGIGLLAGHPHKYLAPGQGGYMGRAMATQTLSAVTGACLVVEKTKYLSVGGLDEEHLPVAFNDVDLCLKLSEAGFRTIYTPYAALCHLESISRGFDTTKAKADAYRREAEHMATKWGDRVRHDPYYNRNLTREREDFSIGD